MFYFFPALRGSFCDPPRLVIHSCCLQFQGVRPHFNLTLTPTTSSPPPPPPLFFATMSLADAVKALKFVKQDLEKHKSLLADKEREVQELSSQLTSLKKAPTPSVPASNGNTNLLGLEMEPSSNNGTPDPAMASLKEQVATLTSEKKVLKNHAKSLSKELEENRSKVTDLNTIVENLGKEVRLNEERRLDGGKAGGKAGAKRQQSNMTPYNQQPSSRRFASRPSPLASLIAERRNEGPSSGP